LSNSTRRFPKRSTAYKLNIKDITESDFFQEEMEDKKISYAVTSFGLKISRVRIYGDVSYVKPRENESTGNIKSVYFVVNDGTEDIGVNAFLESQYNARYYESIKISKDLKLGDSVDVIGRIRKREDKFSIIPEIIRRIEDPNLETLRELEKVHLKLLIKKKKFIPDRKSPEKVQEESKVEEKNIDFEEEEASTAENNDEIGKILAVIEEQDEEDGVTIEKISTITNIDMDRLRRIVRELFEDGTIYEPRAGKYKKL